ncbi:MAG: hypothetical protein K1X94_15255 [Sandaracinaceae bacterium]|nr:hypothetical protein [Sandaracinaceae bacterium]
MRLRSLGIAVSLLVPSLTLGACLERRLESVAPCTRSSVTQALAVHYVDSVDLLFVIDDSGSMDEEQRSLERELPRLVSVLASGDRDGDGAEDFRPVRSLHVGVVSTDLGAGVATPHTLGACVHGSGDDGRLRRTDAVCSGLPADGVFDFARGDDLGAFVSTVQCGASLGTDGCGLEQPLEAALEAISPADATGWTAAGYDAPRFLDPDTGLRSRAGHAEGANAGFVRDDSVLAVVVVTDEEDCSASDTAIFGDDAATAARFGGDVQLRCTRLADPGAGVLHAVDRYVRGLVGLRREPGLVVFSAIAGIPHDLVASAATERGFDFDAILGDPRMGYEETGERANFLRDACTSPSGSADPARRVIETARGLANEGAGVSLASICDEDFGPAIDGVIARIADALNGACLPRDLNPDAEGRVDCEVFEVLPTPGTTSAVTACSGLAGRELFEVVERGGTMHERCRVTQLDRATGLAGSAAGWFYDDASEERRASCGDDGQRISFTEIARPALGSVIELECLQTIGPAQEHAAVSCDEASAPCELGMFCEPGDGDRCGTGTSLPDGAGVALVCDEVERLCAAPCTNDADCRTAGLSGYVCDLRTNGEAAGTGATELDPAIAAATRARCVNPTCH